MSGDDSSWMGSDYWSQRHSLTRALENYNGSVYIIQGMQDWNADQYYFPVHQQLEHAGIEVKTQQDNGVMIIQIEMEMLGMPHYPLVGVLKLILTP